MTLAQLQNMIVCNDNMTADKFCNLNVFSLLLPVSCSKDVIRGQADFGQIVCTLSPVTS